MRLRLMSLLLAALLVGCGGGGGGTSASPTSNSYTGTQSPGDLWTATFGTGTFSASNTNTTNAVTFSGTTALQASGLLQLTVTTTDNPAKVAVGAIGYALEYPGTATLMLPPGTTVNAVSDTRPVVLVGKAASAGFTTGTTFNWVDVPTSIWTTGTTSGSTISCPTSTGNVLGTGSVTAVSGTTITISINEYDYCGTQTTTNVSQTLTDLGSGEVQGTNGGVTITFQVSPSGAFMGDTTAATLQNVAGFIGMKAPSVNVDTTAFYSQNRTFRGFVFRTVSGSGSPFTEPVGGTVTAGGTTMSGFTMNPVTGALASGGNTISLGTTQVAPGVFNGATITTASGVHRATFVINQVNGKYFVYGFGYDSLPFNFMLIEQ